MLNNKLNKNFAFKKFKKDLIVHFGAEEAEKIWSAAGKRYDELILSDPKCDNDSKNFIMPAVAVYQTNAETLPLLREYAKQFGTRIGKLVHAITSIPGVSQLLWRNMPKLMRKMSSPEKGYERRIVSETKELVGVDILVCPLHQAATRYGSPEVASVICAMDKAYMTGFKHIDYTRSSAIGDGDEYCDYRLKWDRNKR